MRKILKTSATVILMMLDSEWKPLNGKEHEGATSTVMRLIMVCLTMDRKALRKVPKHKSSLLSKKETEDCMSNMRAAKCLIQAAVQSKILINST